MRAIGMHLRLTNTLGALIERALRLKLDTFQCFLIHQARQRLIEPTSEEIINVNELLKNNFKNAYLHASYWINPARGKRGSYRLLQREIEMAQKLGFTHIILHPGSAKELGDKEKGIKLLAETINSILHKNYTVQLVLENVCHGGYTIGANLDDFVKLRSLLEQPERVKYCIDTAHTFLAGYDISDSKKQDDFIALLDKKLGLQNIVLIHLNDTNDRLASRLDKHQIPGRGTIGEQALQRFITHPQLKHIPIIMEPPALNEQEQVALVKTIRAWHKE